MPHLPDLTRLDQQHLWHPFTPMRQWCAPEHTPLMLVSGHGCTLRDQSGNEYLDGNASIWTNAHGHTHPAITFPIGGTVRMSAKKSGSSIRILEH